MNSKENNYDERFNFIYNAINDTQETIRFTDAKSGSVIVVVMGLIAGVVTLIDKYYLLLNKLPSLCREFTIVGVTCFIVSILASLILSLLSINPSNNPNEHIDIGEFLDKPNIKYYLSGLNPKMRLKDYLWEPKDLKFSTTVSEYYKNIEESEDSDLLKALSYELIKLSYIKEKKIYRTKASLKWVEKSIWIAIFTIVMVLITYSTQIQYSFNVRNLNCNLLLYLFVGHILGDFLLQTSWQAENKSKNWSALLIHSLIYSMAVYLLAFFAGGISLIDILLIFLTHVLLDKGNFVNWWLITVKKELNSNAQIRFLVDQSLHLIVLLIITIVN